MVIFEKKRQNLIKIHPKTHQIAPFKKVSYGSIPPNPLAMRMASPALPNPGDVPGY